MARKKTGDQRRRERLRHYRREYARLKTRLREVGFICEGTLVERWMQCGKPNCACATDRASQHGPYYQLSWKEKGKTVSRRLPAEHGLDRKSTRLNSSHLVISYAVFCLKKKKQSRKLPLKLTQNSQR